MLASAHEYSTGLYGIVSKLHTLTVYRCVTVYLPQPFSLDLPRCCLGFPLLFAQACLCLTLHQDNVNRRCKIHLLG